jgi:hypothetical protein
VIIGKNATNSHRKLGIVVFDYWKSKKDEKTQKHKVAKKKFATLNHHFSETVRLRELVFVAFNSGYVGLLNACKIIHGGSKKFLNLFLNHPVFLLLFDFWPKS